MTPLARYRTDPTFRHLVDTFRVIFAQFTTTGAGVTPSEIREASGLAWQIHMERNPEPLLIEEPRAGVPFDWPPSHRGDL